MTGDVQNYEIFMEALRRTSPVPIEIGPISGTMDGSFRPSSQSITVREGMNQVQTISVTLHEITHSLLHNQEQGSISAAGTEQAEKAKPKDRNMTEVEAESVSYAVHQYYGIETGEDSFGYIATWSKDRSLPELKASLETIGKTANALIASIDRHFKEICKERWIDLAQPEQVAPESDAPMEPLADTLPGEEPFKEPPPDVLPDPLERADTSLDEYPMSGLDISADALSVGCNYTDGYLFPLSRGLAMELLEQDFTVYMVQFGENPSMVFDTEELLEYSPEAFFAVPREEWEASPDSHQAIEDLVPAEHFLKKLEAALNLSFVYEETAQLYSRK